MNRTDTLSLQDHLDRLFGRINYERQNTPRATDFKLNNMLELARRLGDPHLAYPVIHVAGTKGKGSVCTYIGAVLTAAGKRTGVYTSPHLETVHQRMSIDGQIISDEQLLNVLQQMQPVVEEMDARSTEMGLPGLTFFEVITAAAMLYFSNQKVDVVILEVGMGGRLDSTNICQPDLCVITNISLDHTEQLGLTVERIAREKAGVIKPGVPVVSGAVHPEVLPVIADKARECSAELFVKGQDFACHALGKTEVLVKPEESSADQPLANLFDVRGSIGGSDFEWTDLKVTAPGHHQQVNATLAAAAIQVLVAQGWSISQEQVRCGLRTAHLEGRTEIVSRHPTIVVDLAHNVASILALVETLREELPTFNAAARRRLIFAASREKDVQGMLQGLAGVFDQICLTQFTANPRGMPVEQLKRIAVQIPAAGETDWLTQPDSQAAWQWCRESMDEQDFVCITGSVFLVAELRPRIMQSMLERS
ncbi:MAG: bifunctional folylpolyglutamate synthase/dihydrofolate synthase [Mariniblastus sp.]|nr:bifunctional folylpolyglutamate synthase/dihydrofolate synthase [Mariniblastus sp.]